MTVKDRKPVPRYQWALIFLYAGNALARQVVRDVKTVIGWFRR